MFVIALAKTYLEKIHLIHKIKNHHSVEDMHCCSHYKYNKI